MGIVETPETPSTTETTSTQAPQAPASNAAEAKPATESEEKAEPEATQAPTAVGYEAGSNIQTGINNTMVSVKRLETSLQTKLGNWLKDVYSSNKILFYTVIPVMGIIYGVIKYHNLLINFLISNSKNILQSQQNQDAQAAAQAAATQKQADDLVTKADSLPGQEQPVNDDWYTKS
jgi:hypothetical protein